MDPEANAKAPMLSGQNAGSGVQTTVRLSAADLTVPQRVSANSSQNSHPDQRLRI